MSILYPVSGGFYTLAIRFLDPSFAFAMGWNYVLQWAIVLPLEITVATTTVGYWKTDVPVAGWVTIFWILIIIATLFGTLGFAEEEFWTSLLKLFVVVLFVFIGIVCICGGGPNGSEYDSYVGGRYWKEPGPFANGFKGVATVFVTAAFSFAGTELVGLAASETPNPRESMPSAVKGTFWRITVIYITSLTIIGLLIPYTDGRLLGSQGGGAAASPFVIALDNAKIKGLNHFINITICVSVLSIGLSCVYAGSRTLTALAETGYAPKMFTYVDKSSRPLFSILAIMAFAPLAYLEANPKAKGAVFTWLLALSGLSTLFTWLSICLCHIRFRSAWKAQGHSIEELPYQAFGGVYGSWFGVVLIVVVLVLQLYTAISPISPLPNSAAIVENFFGLCSFFFSCTRFSRFPNSHGNLAVYLAVPVMILFYGIGYVWKRTLPQKASEIDLDVSHP